MYVEKKTTLHDARTATHTGGTISVAGANTVGLQVAGTFGGTVGFQASVDNSNWVSILGINRTTGASGTSTTAAGLHTIPVSGMNLFRAPFDYLSGTVNVNVLAFSGESDLPQITPVTGTFWQTTQPVNGTVGVSGTVPVSGTLGATGTFWQTTQPVSGTLGVSGTVPVSGTFWQTTQPVKGAGFSATATFVVDVGAYSIGDAAAVMGTLTGAVSANGKRSIINTLTLIPNDAMPAIPFNLWLCNGTLTSTPAKNDVFTIAAADGTVVLGIVPITSADYVPSQTSWNVATLRGVGLEFQAGAATTSVFPCLVCAGTTAPVATSLTLTAYGEYVD